jgi:hypothetical protein
VDLSFFRPGREDLMGIGVEVKDSAHFPEKWASLNFDEDTQSAKANAKSDCFPPTNKFCTACTGSSSAYAVKQSRDMQSLPLPSGARREIASEIQTYEKNFTNYPCQQSNAGASVTKGPGDHPFKRMSLSSNDFGG